MILIQKWNGYIIGKVICEESDLPFEFKWYNWEYILYRCSS